MITRKITISDLLDFKFIGDPQISPDGEKVVFIVKTIDQENNCYQTYLHLGVLENGEVHQFTFGDGKDSAPRWSPDGKWIAFNRVTDGCPQIWLIPSDGGEARQLTNLDEGDFGPPGWSPDGRKIAFNFRPTHPSWTKKAKAERKDKNLSNPPREITRRKYRVEGQGYLDMRTHLWVFDLLTSELNQITNGDFDDGDFTWSPDEDHIAFVSNRSDDIIETPFLDDIWLVSVESGALKLIKTPHGYKRSLSYSPNGKQIAYIGFETNDDPWSTHNDRLWVVNTKSETADCLTQSLDRFAENVTLSDVRENGNQTPIWVEEGENIVVSISDRGSCHLYAVSLEGGIIPLTTGKMDINAFSVNPSKKRGVFLMSTPTQLTEAYSIEWSGDKFVECKTNCLTKFNHSLLKNIQLSESEEIWFLSFDQTEIQGWLLKPPDFDPKLKYPLILYIHGGPAAQYGYTFFHEFQSLAANGFLVLFCNPRGSLGRDENFLTCIQGNWGELDYKDLMAAVGYAENLPFVNAEKMGVIGGSYGGFMTTWVVGHTNRFQCAITERGVSNRHSAVGTSDSAPLPEGYWRGNAWDNPEHIWQQSPLRMAANIHTPLLIIHSEGDWRCRIEQADQLFSALTALKREVVYLRYPIETGHGFSRNGPPDLRLDRLNRIIDWLTQYLS